MDQDNQAVLFCGPGGKYKNMSRIEAAKAYSKFAFEEYDKFVTFGKGYNPSKIDVKFGVLKKEGKWIYVTVYANQPVRTVGGESYSLRSSSYLFNPEPDLEGRLLPDLDVIEFNGMRENVDKAAFAVAEFYRKAGWRTKIYKGEVEKMEVVPDDFVVTLPKVDTFLNKERFPHGLVILRPQAVIGHAVKLVDYNKDSFSFKWD